jgi:hypothetical protein
MRLLRFFSVLSLLGMLAGCGEPQADLSKPKTHRSAAITFKYPASWKVSDELVTPEIHHLFIETPGNAVVILQSYRSEEADDLQSFSKAFSSVATTEMPIGKMVGTTFADMPETDGYQWIVENFSIKVLGESVPHRRIYGTKEIGERQVFLIFQVATEDYPKAKAGFQLILNSLHGVQIAEPSGTGQPATGSGSNSEQHSR